MLTVMCWTCTLSPRSHTYRFNLGGHEAFDWCR